MVEKKLRGLSANKSPGPDGWHPIFLKNIKDLISFPLATLFQKSLNEGIVTSQWLEAYISPIYKKGNKNMCENYRPVSLTSVLCKLMESIIRDKLLEHMRKNDIISNKQHGFVPFGSCMSNLLICIEMWSEMIEANCSMDVIYTDFAKAFDRVSHAKLLQKIKSVGIVGNTCVWIRSLLKDRSQKVRVDDAYSSSAKVKSGIPQGSVLGPIPFIIFINDMPDIIESTCQMFADDANIFCKVNTNTDSMRLQDDLTRLSEWSKLWKLPFNIGKCKSLHNGRSNNRTIYKMDNQEL